MRKFVWVPVISLGKENTGQFLEIMSEPASLGGIDMDALSNSGLNPSVALTQTVLRLFDQQPSSAKLYVTGFLTNLSNTQGINLGLLAACFIQIPTCHYQKIIVTGQLNAEQALLPITETGYFETKVSTILNLGEQAQPIPFYFPKLMQTEANQRLLSQLVEINILLKPINSFFDILADLKINQAN
jgi:hypothetical protein